MIVFPAAANKARSNILDVLELLDLRSRVSAEYFLALAIAASLLWDRVCFNAKHIFSEKHLCPPAMFRCKENHICPHSPLTAYYS